MQDADLASALEKDGSPEALAMAIELRSGKLTPLPRDGRHNLKGQYMFRAWARYLPGEPHAAKVPAHLARQIPQLVEKLRAAAAADIELLAFGTKANDPSYVIFREVEGGHIVCCLRLRRRIDEEHHGA